MKALKFLFYNSPTKLPKQLNQFLIIVSFVTLFCVFSIMSFAQNIGINSTGIVPDNSAGLDINFTDKGLLIPRVALTGTGDLITIASPATSLLVYNTGTGGLSTVGYYYNSGTTVVPNWIRLNTGSGSGWLITGNAGTVDGTNFLGTTDNVPLNFKIFNNKAGRIASTGESFFGYLSGNNNTATTSTGFGYMALNANTSGNNNTAMGYNALPTNTTGIQNTAVGYNALLNNNIGSYNTALGWEAGRLITGDGVSNGYYNTAIGYEALWSVKGSYNVGIGGQNGMNNWAPADEANNNTWVGFAAGFQNDVGDDNVMIGYYAGSSNQRGCKNTMIGSEAGKFVLSPVTNSTCIGYRAGYGTLGLTYSNNIFVGYQAGDNISTGANNLIIGYDIDVPAPTGNNQLSIGNLIFGTGIDGTGTTISSGNIGIGTTLPATNAKLAFKNGHLQSQQTTAPIITASPYVTYSLTNATDVAGKISITTTVAVGTVTITFNKTYTTAPIVVITPTNLIAATEIARVYVTSSTTNFILNFSPAPSAAAHTYSYHVIETQ